MKKEQDKTNTESQFLELLKRVLPKATHNPKLADQIYQAVEHELKAKARSKAFSKFCDKLELPDLEPKSIESARRQLAESFGEGDITIKPNKKEQSLSVEVALLDGSQFNSEIKVNPHGHAEESDEQEVTLKFIPCPVALPGDKELVWLLAKRENISPEEAAISLSKLEEEFWASKTGQKLQREGVEKCFPEFISRVPAGPLGEMGLKRHYKTPEPIKIIRGRPQQGQS